MKDKDNFKKVLNSLDKAQQEAVLSKDKYIFVSGGPGTGKTKVVFCHSAFLILERDFKCDEILIFSGLTFVDFEKRLYELIRMNYSEIHPHYFVPFCMKILKKNWYLIEGVSPNFELLNNFKRNIIIEEVTKDAKKYRWEFGSVKSEIPKFIRFLKLNNIRFDDLNTMIEEGILDRKYANIKDVYKAYSDILNRHNYLDYEDVVLKTLEFFEDTEKSAFYSEKFKKLIVDDFSEINPLQYRLIKVLVDKTKNIFITGNYEQDEFGFNSEFAKNIMDKFFKDFRDAGIIHLEKNYRSDRKLLSAAEKFCNNKNSIFASAEHNYPECLLTVAVEKSIIDEAFYIGKKIKSIITTETKSISSDADIKEAFTYSDFAVLLRNIGDYGFMYKQVFDYLKIPNTIEGSLNISCFKELNYLLLYLKLLDNPYSNNFKTLLSNSFSGFGPVELKYLSEFSKKKRKNFYELMKDIESGDIILDEKYDEVINKVKIFINKFDKLLKSLQKLSFPDFILRVVYSVFFADLPEGINQIILNRFIDVSVEYYEICSSLKWECSLKDFLQFFEENRQNFFDNLKFGEEESDAVKITSIFTSKGKEFTVVFIPLLTEDNIPSVFSGERFFIKDFENVKKSYKIFNNKEYYFTGIRDFNDHINKEKNLFLTAITRAREKLFLSYPKNMPGVEEVHPSVFLSNLFDGKEINKNNCENVDNLPLIFEENGYSDFFENIVNSDEQELYKQIISQEELEIVLRKFKPDKEKLLKLLGGYNIDSLDENYLFSDKSALQEKELSRNISDSFTFSHTSIKTYLDCPRKFYYSKILGLKAPKSIHLTIGIIEHEIVQKIHQQMKGGQFDEDVFHKIFDEIWGMHKSEFENDFYERVWKEYVLEIIQKYLNKYGKFAESVYLIERNFEFLLDSQYIISGKIDRIDKLDDGCEIIDYKKSGSQKKEALINQFYKKNENFQIPIYYIAVKSVLQLEPKILSNIFFDFKKSRECEKVEIYIKESDIKNKMRHITPEMIEEVESKLISILGQISMERKSFDRSEDAKCRDYGGIVCEYINICNQSQ